ncbi:MAG: radical SAM protein, partial [Patescibacteria group bacterium]
MNNQSRKEQFSVLYPVEPAFRWTQIEQAFFNQKFSGWNDILNLPNNMRQTLADNVPWISCQLSDLQKDKAGDTFKAALKLTDGEKIETVLMANARGQFSVCVSTQVGCAMNCAFCATGKMGLKRNLTADEIVDQLRFWRSYLKEKKSSDERISNIVLMGMGEPLANYDSVKTALNAWLKFTDIGPTHITVSTVGLLQQLETLLIDKNWPPVRLAIS